MFRRLIHRATAAPRSLALASAVALALVAQLLAAVPTVAAADGAGPYGTRITLASGVSLSGYDIAVDAAGTAYVGWIADASGGATRTVFLCVLPSGASACQGGIQSTASLGLSSAAGLKVLAPAGGSITLVWFHDTDQSVNGPDNAKVATATVTGGVLGSAQDRAAAPSFGSLLTAAAAPDGAIWPVLKANAAATSVRVLPGLSGTPATVNAGFIVGSAKLAFHGSTPVVVFSEAGAIGTPLRAATMKSGSWTSAASVAKTWAVGGAFDVVSPKGSVQLVSAVNNASYLPQIATWNGSKFGAHTKTGDTNPCAPSSHDLVTDKSGRIADASLECNQVTVANHPTRAKAAIVRFNVGGTPAGGPPQIATLSRGVGWVAWSRLSGSNGSTLLVQAVRLPGMLKTVTRKASAGKVTLKGPASCLPAVAIKATVTGKAAKGWNVGSKVLKLDGSKHGATVNGVGLAAGSVHTLSGTVKFKKGGQTRKVTAKLSFTACP